MGAENPRFQEGAINDPKVRFFDAYSIRNEFLREYANIIHTVDGWFWEGDLKMLDWVTQQDFNRDGGVTEGTIQYLKEERGLVPFMSYHHKLYLCRYNAYHKWMDAVSRLGFKRNQITLCGYSMYNVCTNV